MENNRNKPMHDNVIALPFVLPNLSSSYLAHFFYHSCECALDQRLCLLSALLYAVPHI
jgi:hypothetical protein